MSVFNTFSFCLIPLNSKPEYFAKFNFFINLIVLFYSAVNSLPQEKYGNYLFFFKLFVNFQLNIIKF
jgi:hypothetical protein